MRLVIVAGLAFTTSLFAIDNDSSKRLGASAAVFSEVMAAPDKGIPQDLLEKAYCIVIVPDLKTGAFIVGGKYGKGFLSCRNQERRRLVCARRGSHRGRQRWFSDRRFLDGPDHAGHVETRCGQAASE